MTPRRSPHGMERLATDCLRAIAVTEIRLAVEQPATYELLFSRNEEVKDEPDFETAKRAALDVCRRALADAATDGELQMGPRRADRGASLLAAAHGVVSLHLGGQLVMCRSLDRLVPIRISTLMTGPLQQEEES